MTTGHLPAEAVITSDNGRVIGRAEENQIMPVAIAYAPCGTTRQDLDDSAGVAGLVARAGGGDRQAWDALVERYAPLIWSICRKYRLGRADADDVGQNVWVRLV